MADNITDRPAELHEEKKQTAIASSLSEERARLEQSKNARPEVEGLTELLDAHADAVETIGDRCKDLISSGSEGSKSVNLRASEKVTTQEPELKQGVEIRNTPESAVP